MLKGLIAGLLVLVSAGSVSAAEFFTLPLNFTADAVSTIGICITAILAIGVVVIAFRFGRRILGF